MAALGFGNAAVVMMLQNKDIATAIRTSSPSVYLQVSKDRLSNLQAEFEDAQEMGESTIDIEEKLNQASKEVRIMERRIQVSPGLPDTKIEISPPLSNGDAKTATDRREILAH